MNFVSPLKSVGADSTVFPSSLLLFLFLPLLSFWLSHPTFFYFSILLSPCLPFGPRHLISHLKTIPQFEKDSQFSRKGLVRLSVANIEFGVSTRMKASRFADIILKICKCVFYTWKIFVNIC